MEIVLFRYGLIGGTCLQITLGISIMATLLMTCDRFYGILRCEFKKTTKHAVYLVESKGVNLYQTNFQLIFEARAIKRGTNGLALLSRRYDYISSHYA